MLTVNGRSVKDYSCLSTDSKPVKAANGSILVEVDTGDIYIFDETSKTWNKMCSIKE